MKTYIKVISAYESDAETRIQEVSYPIAATRNRFNGLDSFEAVEKFFGQRLDSDCLIRVEFYESDGEDEADLLAEKEFYSGFTSEGEVLVIIPHQMPATFETMPLSLPWYRVYAGYRLWDVNAYYRFPSLAEAQEWAKSYDGHQWEKVRQLLFDNQ